MFEAISAPRKPSLAIARSNSTAASAPSCIGTDARPTKRLGCFATASANRSLSQRAYSSPLAAGIQKKRTGGSQRLHVDTLMVHDRQAQIEIGKFAFRLCQQGPVVTSEHVAVPLILFQLETVRSGDITGCLKAAGRNVMSVHVDVHMKTAGGPFPRRAIGGKQECQVEPGSW
jgi:hypothetical protein